MATSKSTYILYFNIALIVSMFLMSIIGTRLTDTGKLHNILLAVAMMTIVGSFSSFLYIHFSKKENNNQYKSD